MDKDLEDPKILAENGDKEATWADANQDGGNSTAEELGRDREMGDNAEEEEKGEKMDDEVKVSVEETGKREGGGEVQIEHKGGRQNGRAEEEEEKIAEEVEKNKETPQEAQRNKEPLENGEVASVEGQKQRTEDGCGRAVEVVVVVNGLRDEEEKEDGHVLLAAKLPETTEDAINREPLAEANPTNRSPDGAQ